MGLCCLVSCCVVLPPGARSTTLSDILFFFLQSDILKGPFGTHGIPVSPLWISMKQGLTFLSNLSRYHSIFRSLSRPSLYRFLTSRGLCFSWGFLRRPDPLSGQRASRQPETLKGGAMGHHQSHLMTSQLSYYTVAGIGIIHSTIYVCNCFWFDFRQWMC